MLFDTEHTFATMFVLPHPNYRTLEPDYPFKRLFSVSLCLCVTLLISSFVCFRLEMALWHKKTLFCRVILIITKRLNKRTPHKMSLHFLSFFASSFLFRIFAPCFLRLLGAGYFQLFLKHRLRSGQRIHLIAVSNANHACHCKSHYTTPIQRHTRYASHQRRHLCKKLQLLRVCH